MDVTLKTNDGRPVLDRPITITFASAPDVLVWGNRTFCYRGEDTKGVKVYHEANCVYTIPPPT